MTVHQQEQQTTLHPKQQDQDAVDIEAQQQQQQDEKHCTYRRLPIPQQQQSQQQQQDVKLQSHNYEPDESKVWRAYVAQQHYANRGQWWTMGKKRALKRWVLTFLIGVAQALVATTCNLATKVRLWHVFCFHVSLLLWVSLAQFFCSFARHSRKANTNASMIYWNVELPKTPFRLPL